VPDATPVLDVDALLTPIPGSSPAGGDVRYDPVSDKLKAARRAAEQQMAEVDESASASTLAAWAGVADLAADVLRKQSKDLQVALWLLEALSRIEGFRGAMTGLMVVRRLIDERWDDFYPRIEADDDEPLGFRTGLMTWIDERLPALLKLIPVAGPPAAYSLLHYEAALKTGEEKKALLEDGWPSGEQFDAVMKGSSLTFLEQTLAELQGCQSELQALERLTDERFIEKRVTPSGAERIEKLVSFGSLRGLLETAIWLVDKAAKPKRPKPSVETPVASGESADASVAGPSVAAARAGDDGWSHARELALSNQLEGLRVLQARVIEAPSGRDRFIRQLQFAEVCLEAGMPSLAFPMFDDISKTIESRQLEAWETRDVIVRAWMGLAQCCERLKGQMPELAARQQEAIERASSLGGSVRASSATESS
jgi:type VI secretion system protein ImpA